MRLERWLALRGMNATGFARVLGTSVSTVTRLLPKNGKKQRRNPSLDLAARIAQATEGAVTANDFMDNDEEAGSVPRLANDEAPARQRDEAA